jgi:hypothetical protein
MAEDDDEAGKWVRRIESSELKAKLEQARVAAEHAAVTSGGESADRQRILAVLSVLEQTLKAADPEVARETALDEIVASLDTMASNLNLCQTAANALHMAAAVRTVDPILASMSTIHVARNFEEGGEAISKFKQSVNGSRAAATRQLDELEDRINTLNALLEQRVAAVSTEVDAIADAATTSQSQIQQLQLGYQNAFDEAQTNRTADHDKQLKGQRAEADADLAEARIELAAFRETEATRVSKLVEEAEASNARIDEILGLVGEKGLVGKYAESADAERRSAHNWRIAAGVVASGAVIVAVVSAANRAEGGLLGFAPKLTLTLLIGALAAYCGSVANGHRKTEKQARQVGLQLAAIKPYLHDLTDTTLRDVVLSVVATQLFNGAGTSGADSDAIKGLGLGGQIGDVLVEQLGKALLARK